jgi:beta-glucanase (GH16 family)
MIRFQTKSAALLLLAFALAASLLTAQAPRGYKLSWSDEFNGTSLDPSQWTYRTDSKLLSTQTPQNVSVRNGNLVIALRKQQAGGKDYTGGGIISRKTFQYGYYEARLKIVAGSGWHSSFWMQRYNGTDTAGDKATLEMDVIENTSHDLTTYSVNTHRWVAPHIERGLKPVATPDLSKDYHVFGCEYAPDVIRYFFDGKLVQTVDWAGLPQGEVNIWLTSIAQAMGPAHNVDDSALPGAMYVDWVRFYTK